MRASFDRSLYLVTMNFSEMLLPELEYEALQFAARDTLDAYQLLSRKKNKLVKKYSDVFALRRVSRVIIVSFKQDSENVTATDPRVNATAP